MMARVPNLRLKQFIMMTVTTTNQDVNHPTVKRRLLPALPEKPPKQARAPISRPCGKDELTQAHEPYSLAQSIQRDPGFAAIADFHFKNIHKFAVDDGLRYIMKLDAKKHDAELYLLLGENEQMKVALLNS
jgi:hypothetical protein